MRECTLLFLCSSIHFPVRSSTFQKSQKGKENVKKDVATLARQAEKAEQSHTYITVSRKQ